MDRIADHSGKRESRIPAQCRIARGVRALSTNRQARYRLSPQRVAMSDFSPANSDSAPSPGLPPAGTPGSSTLTGVVVAVVVALYFGRVVLIPVTLAMLLSFLLTPVVELLRRLRL